MHVLGQGVVRYRGGNFNVLESPVACGWRRWSHTIEGLHPARDGDLQGEVSEPVHLPPPITVSSGGQGVKGGVKVARKSLPWTRVRSLILGHPEIQKASVTCGTRGLCGVEGSNTLMPHDYSLIGGPECQDQDKGEGRSLVLGHPEQ